jgi:Rrf2 family protein
MLRLNRTTEYGIFALRYLDQKGESASASAREIADQFGLPFDITAKTLQRLKDSGLIASAQGSRGGYKLQRRLEQVNLGEFLELMEGPQAVVACAGHEGPACEYSNRCEIDGVLRRLNGRIQAMLSTVMLSEFAANQNPMTRHPAVLADFTTGLQAHEVKA